MGRSQARLSVIVTIDFKDSVEEFLEHISSPDLNLEGIEFVIAQGLGLKGYFGGRGIKKKPGPNGSQLIICSQIKKSRASLRNLALRQASADLYLLFAGDFKPTPETFQAHLDFHAAHTEVNAVSIGGGIFLPGKSSPFMKWIEESGHLFGVPFLSLPDGQEVDYFYGANACLKSSFIKSAGPFDETFLYDTGDDFDMGMRLKQLGMKSFYLRAADAYHVHDVTIPQRLDALRNAARTTPLLDKKYGSNMPWSQYKSKNLTEFENQLVEFEKKSAESEEALFAYYAALTDLTFAKEYQRVDFRG